MSNGKQWHELAQEIFESILAEADAARDGKWEDVPPFITIRPKPTPPELAHLERFIPKSIVLSYMLEGEAWDDDDDPVSQPWIAKLLLYAEGLPHIIYLKCEAMLEKFLSSNMVTYKDGHKTSLGEALSPDLRASILEEYVRDAIELYIYRLLDRLVMAFNEHSREAHLLAFTTLQTRLTEMMEEEGVEVINDPDEALANMQRLLTRTATERRRFLKAEIEACLGALDFTDLARNYREVLPMWKDAKLIYKQNSNRANWRGVIRAAYPDVEFDDDLISRLSGKLNDLPEEVQAKLSEKGGDSKPSSIALEHAARLCGAQPYQYSLRHLYNIKNETERHEGIDDEEING